MGCSAHAGVRFAGDGGRGVVLLAQACQTRSLTGQGVRRSVAWSGGRVIGVHHSAESKLGSYFAEGLEQAGLSRAALIVSTEAEDDAGLLKVTVALSSVADWKLRSEVHQVAMRVEDEHDVTVLCFFQPLDPVPFAPRHVRAPKHAR